jgi:hypothetical protein
LKWQRPTTSSAIAAALALGLVLRQSGPRGLGIGLKELGLLSGLHRSSSLDTSEEASVGGERHLHLSSLLEEITAGLDSAPAIGFEQQGAQIIGGLLALSKELLGGEAISRCSEAIKSSVEKHLKHWGEVLVLLYEGLVLGLLLTVVVG